VLLLCLGGQLIVTCRRSHDDGDVTETPRCVAIDYITDAVRPCPRDLSTFDYLLVSADDKYIVGVESQKRRIAVLRVGKLGSMFMKTLLLLLLLLLLL